jgi:maleate cis-trans isomerase
MHVVQVRCHSVLSAAPIEAILYPGLISWRMEPYIKSVVGVDISQAMVDIYNTRVKKENIDPEKMYAFRGEITEGLTQLGDVKVDVVTVRMISSIVVC